VNNLPLKSETLLLVRKAVVAITAGPFEVVIDPDVGLRALMLKILIDQQKRLGIDIKISDVPMVGLSRIFREPIEKIPVLSKVQKLFFSPSVNRGDKRGHLPAQNGATLGMSGALWRVCSSHS